jgi:hypothetical protein
MKVCYFGIDENEDLSEFWDEIKEPKQDKPTYSETNYTNFEMSLALEQNKPDEWYCWQGTRIPQWFE